MSIYKFSGHHGRTFPAWKQPPIEDSVSHLKRTLGHKFMGLRSHRINNKSLKRRHNRKSRQWFRNEIRHIIRDEPSKL